MVMAAHSAIPGRCEEKIKGRWAAILSQRIKIKNNKPTKDSKDPAEERAFQSA